MTNGKGCVDPSTACTNYVGGMANNVRELAMELLLSVLLKHVKIQ